MVSNGEDDTPTLTDPPIGHPANREMLATIGNYVLEAQAHGTKLQSLYEELRGAIRPVSVLWGERLLTEEQRHHAVNETNLRDLEHVVSLRTAR